MLGDRQRFAGEQRIVGVQFLVVDEAQVGRQAVAGVGAELASGVGAVLRAVDGKKVATLRGPTLAADFKARLLDYIERRYGARPAAD